MNTERLLNVARALRESLNPDLFDMSTIAHSCDTPACALGHYAARPDLQDAFQLSEIGCMVGGNGDLMWYDGVTVRAHFDITRAQAEQLFGPDGCGGAQTASEAAEYIEAFCAE